MRIVGRYLATLLVAAAGLVLGISLATRPARAIVNAGKSSDTTKALELTTLSERSVVYDRNGGVLAVLHFDENRSPVTLEQVPKHVIDAILDVEDDSFFQHEGVNLRSILRAALTNAESGEIRQGGSTITQQLVKQSLLTPERNLERKVKVAVYALRLEDQMTKEQILEQYLNTVYFGYGAYGVQAAAETYWGVQAGELTVEQGAFLAGIIRNPVGYDPFKRPEVTRARRDFALQRMVVRGDLAQDKADELKDVPLPDKRHEPNKTRDDYFVEEVKQALLDDTRLGETPQERFNAVFRGGLRIETTYDPRLQLLAEEAVAENIPDTKGRFVGALVSVEPSTGAVRAMVAGRGFEQARYNLATGRGGSGRQAGSSFKTFVLLTALENGIGPNDTISGSEPCPVKGVKGQVPDPYEPGNYEGTRGGTGPLHAATAKSLNCAFIRLGISLDTDAAKSLDKIHELANRLGLKRVDESTISMSLGVEEVTPLEMASAYGTIANEGVRHEPYFVERVKDRSGKVLFERKGDGKRVLDQNVARAATWTLRKVVEGGTGTRARLSGRQVAGKTGTAQNWQDAWFVGYTPELSTAVWLGNPLKQDRMVIQGVRVTGGSFPARTWGAFMSQALEDDPPTKFAEPDLDEYGKAEAIKISKNAVGSTRRPSSSSSTSTSIKLVTPTTVVVEEDE